MRIREEIDAIDVLGVDSRVFLVSVRMLAATVMLPFLYILSVAAAELGAYIQSFIRFHDVSAGTYRTTRSRSSARLTCFCRWVKA